MRFPPHDGAITPAISGFAEVEVGPSTVHSDIAMYRERFTQGFDVAPAPQDRVVAPSEALRDYLRSGRFKVARPAPLVRPVPPTLKRHILVLQRGLRDQASQVFDFDTETFDVTITSWRPGEPFMAPSQPVNLIIVDFEAGAYADTAVYAILASALPGVPMIVLATSEGPIDRIVALELGADDFMSKPAHPRELRARARAVLRHTPDQGTTAVDRGMSGNGVHLDLVERAVTTERGRSRLCNVEFWVLRNLLEARGRPISRDGLLDCLEAEVKDVHRDPRAVDVIISRLRKKMDMPGRESLIRTVRGHGYCL